MMIVVASGFEITERKFKEVMPSETKTFSFHRSFLKFAVLDDGI